jgi:hypothetical protein
MCKHKETPKVKRKAFNKKQPQRAQTNTAQDNLCVRGEDCEQANQGQQLAGKDNEATGFNDQSQNANVQAPGAQPTQQPTPDVTPDVTLT